MADREQDLQPKTLEAGARGGRSPQEIPRRNGNPRKPRWQVGGRRNGRQAAAERWQAEVQ